MGRPTTRGSGLEEVTLVAQGDEVILRVFSTPAPKLTVVDLQIRS